MERAKRRVGKELVELQRNPIPGLTLMDVDDIMVWKIKVDGAEDTLYEGELMTLSIVFDASYPLEAPKVIFEAPVPVHTHVYSNGHICLSVLYDDWSPAMGVASICLSILSMLSSATVKKRPHDNNSYVRRVSPSGNPKLTSWDFHDEKA